MKPPHNVAFLERAIRKIVDTNENGIRLRTMMANVIVGQFLDGAVMRGGGSAGTESRATYAHIISDSAEIARCYRHQVCQGAGFN